MIFGLYSMKPEFCCLLHLCIGGEIGQVYPTIKFLIIKIVQYRRKLRKSGGHFLVLICLFLLLFSILFLQFFGGRRGPLVMK